MADFKVIETQEEFEARLKERLERERATIRKDYEDYEALKANNSKLQADLEALNAALTDATSKAQGYDSTIGELNERIRGYETSILKTKIAHEFGIPHELSSKLSGDDEEALRQDAKSLAEFVTKPKVSPRKDLEPNGMDVEKAAYSQLLSGLRKGE